MQKDRQEEARLTLIKKQSDDQIKSQDKKSNKCNLEECKGKSDGAECTYGRWCDENGNVCGGQSCVGLGLGKCLKGQCVSDKEYNNKLNNVGITNPASVYCRENGGTLEVRTGESSGQIGICKFSDGSECEEWKYMRGECKVGDSKGSNKIDTSDWQTYKNNEYGFEFKYPKKWGYIKAGSLLEALDTIVL